MNICIIGDPHGNLEQIKTIDFHRVNLILLNGDLGNATLMRKLFFQQISRQEQGLPPLDIDKEKETEAYFQAYDSTIKLLEYLQNIAPIYLVFGNVESTPEKTQQLSRKLGIQLPSLTTYIEKSSRIQNIDGQVIEFQGLKIAGLSYYLDYYWLRQFKPQSQINNFIKAQIATKIAQMKLSKIPSNIDIFISHLPPHGVLDRSDNKNLPPSWQNKPTGSRLLKQFIQEKSPQHFFCGHIHEAQGERQIHHTKVVNLGYCGHKIITY